jgi:hypothetical protein
MPEDALCPLATSLDASAMLRHEFLESVGKVSGDCQYVPATLRNRDFILDVLRNVLPMTGVILEIASGSGEHMSISREIFRLSFSILPILNRTPLG